MGLLQQFGRALMMPTITIPVAAILLWLGGVLTSATPAAMFGGALELAGHTLLQYLPLTFAVGVALGLTGNSGHAGLAALLGFLVYEQMTRHYLGAEFELGVSEGILIGVLTAVSHSRFHDIRLPESIQFFGGPRFVLLFMMLAAMATSYAMVWCGRFLQEALYRTGDWVIGLGGFGAFLYGVAYRLLVPFGLHHILNNFVWFQVGHYKTSDGRVVLGDLPRFFAGDETAGAFMAGLYPVMMFALPAVAFAIIQEAREDLKPKVRATFLSAALTSFLTGVTEPIEFAFLFAAPYLFVVHALLSGVSMWIAHELAIRHGFSFSAGAIDFVVNYHLASGNAWLLLPIGLAYGVVYYALFRWAIRRFRLPTPGREEVSYLGEWAGDIPYRAPLILQALGGKENILKIEACITRLRLTLVNDRRVDVGALRQLGAAGVIRLGGGNVQVVFGTFSELIREEIVKAMRKDSREVHFHAPVQGRMMRLEEVPDPIFSRGMVGKGVAFLPERGELVAPVRAKVAHVHPTGHALGLKTPEGLDVLLHVGIDSATVGERIFQVVVETGQEVTPGQTLMRFDLARLKKLAKSPAIPMVVTNPEAVRSWRFAPFRTVRKGQASVMSVALKEPDCEGGE